jgi:hypothetical protein
MGRIGWHFPRAPDGAYLGYYPGTSADAIGHLESLREKGAQYLLLPRTAFWWWDFYTELHSFVDGRYAQVWSDKDCLLYKLSRTDGHIVGIEGTIDLVNAGQIAGWAWDSNLPNRPVKVDIYDGRMLLATVPADLFRKDLLDAQKGDGRHGFQLAFQPAYAGVHEIRVLVAGTQVQLAGSPARVVSR